MAYDKVIDSAQLDAAITATADKIRAGTGSAEKIQWDGSKGFADAIPSGAEQATPDISVSSEGLITASATQNAGIVKSGTKNATKQLTVQAAKTITPSTSDQTVVASGVYTTGAVTVKGDANLKAENIAKGVSIFGIAGTFAGGSSGSKVATGSFTSNSSAATISGLGFKPTKILIYLMSEKFFDGTHIWSDFEWEVLYAEYTDQSRLTKVVVGGLVEDDEESGSYFFTLEPYQIQDHYLIPTDDGFTVDFTDGTSNLSYYENYNYIAIG